MKFYLNLSLMVIICSFESSAQTETCLRNLNNSDNRVISQTVNSEMILREYILKIPENYDENTPTSLLINLHGFGDCASDYSELIEDFYNFKAIANEEKIIVVYPQGAYRPEKEDTFWEPGDPGVENIFENDVYFIETLISNLETEFNINPDRIYACGYSNGGMMAYSLACNSSNIFSAIGIMSGALLEESCFLDEAIPIIIFHGIADGVLPYDANMYYRSVTEVVNFWLDQNNIPDNSINSIQLNNGNVNLEEYSGGDNNSCLNFYTIHEEHDKPGGHVWFSDEIGGQPPNQIMWDFFTDNCSIVSSTDVFDKSSFEIYPNPIKNQLKINDANSEVYSIHDINGRLMKTGNLESNAEVINLEFLRPGCYTVQIQNQVRKFIKVE